MPFSPIKAPTTGQYKRGYANHSAAPYHTAILPTIAAQRDVQRYELFINIIRAANRQNKMKSTSVIVQLIAPKDMYGRAFVAALYAQNRGIFLHWKAPEKRAIFLHEKCKCIKCTKNTTFWGKFHDMTHGCMTSRREQNRITAYCSYMFLCFYVYMFLCLYDKTYHDILREKHDILREKHDILRETYFYNFAVNRWGTRHYTLSYKVPPRSIYIIHCYKAYV